MKRLLSVLLIFCFLLQGCETRDAQAERDAASRKRNRIEQTASAQPVTQAVSQSTNAVAQEVSADSASQDPKPQAAAVKPADTKPEEAQTADTPETETQVSANEAPEEETFDNSEAVSALRDGLSRLINARDMVYAYYQGKDVVKTEEAIKGLQMADDLISRINAEDFDIIKPQQVASYYDEMADAMDLMSRLRPPQDPRDIDILELKERLRDSMWIDDDMNTYMFDKNGRNIYIAVAGSDTPFSGTYVITPTDRAIELTFMLPQLTTEIKAEVTRYTGDSLCFTDISTGDVFYLTPIKQ